MIIEIANWIANIFILGLSITLLAVGCFCIMLVIIGGRDLIDNYWKK